MQSNSIKDQINLNINLLKVVEDLAKTIEINSDDKRRMLFSGFFRNTLSHYYSINLLSEKELYNTAFSLIRVFFEGIVRAEFLYKKIDDNKINKIYADQGWSGSFKQFGVMCQEIDSVYNTTYYSDIKDRAYKAMNDYTHSGFNQISSNFNDENGTIESNFSDELILDALVSLNIMLRLFAISYFEKIGLETGQVNESDIETFQSQTQ